MYDQHSHWKDSSELQAQSWQPAPVKMLPTVSISALGHNNQKQQQHNWALFANATGMIKFSYKSYQYQPKSVKITVFSEDNNVTLATVKTTNLNLTKDLKEISCSRSFWKIQKIVCDIKIRRVYPIPPHAAILAWGWSFSRTGRKMRRGLSTTDTMMRTRTVRC